MDFEPPPSLHSPGTLQQPDKRDENIEMRFCSMEWITTFLNCGIGQKLQLRIVEGLRKGECETNSYTIYDKEKETSGKHCTETPKLLWIL